MRASPGDAATLDIVRAQPGLRCGRLALKLPAKDHTAASRRCRRGRHSAAPSTRFMSRPCCISPDEASLPPLCDPPVRRPRRNSVGRPVRLMHPRACAEATLRCRTRGGRGGAVDGARAGSAIATSSWPRARPAATMLAPPARGRRRGCLVLLLEAGGRDDSIRHPQALGHAVVDANPRRKFESAPQARLNSTAGPIPRAASAGTLVLDGALVAGGIPMSLDLRRSWAARERGYGSGTTPIACPDAKRGETSGAAGDAIHRVRLGSQRLQVSRSGGIDASSPRKPARLRSFSRPAAGGLSAREPSTATSRRRELVLPPSGLSGLRACGRRAYRAPRCMAAADLSPIARGQRTCSTPSVADGIHSIPRLPGRAQRGASRLVGHIVARRIRGARRRTCSQSRASRTKLRRITSDSWSGDRPGVGQDGCSAHRGVGAGTNVDPADLAAPAP